DEAVPADGKDDGQDGPRRHEGPDARHAGHDGRRRKAVLVEPTHGRLGLQWSAGPSRGSGPWVGSTHQAGIPFIIAGLPCHSGSWATPKPPWSRSVSPAAAPRSAPPTTSSSPTAVAPATAATSSGWVTTTRSRPAARSASRWTWPACSTGSARARSSATRSPTSTSRSPRPPPRPDPRAAHAARSGHERRGAVRAEACRGTADPSGPDPRRLWRARRSEAGILHRPGARHPPLPAVDPARTEGRARGVRRARPRDRQGHRRDAPGRRRPRRRGGAARHRSLGAAFGAAAAGPGRVLLGGPGRAARGERGRHRLRHRLAPVLDRAQRRAGGARRPRAADPVPGAGLRALGGLRGGRGDGGLGSGVLSASHPKPIMGRPYNPRMRIDVVSLFPEFVAQLAGHGVVGRAAERGLLALHGWNPRDYAEGNYRRVDDRPFGGGPGM